MRKVFSVMALAATMMLGTATVATANEEAKVEIISADQVDNMPVVLAQNEPAADADPATATAEEGEGLVYVLKEQFLTGGPLWMGIVLICLVLGVALAIERIIYLNISTINTRKFMNDVENALQSGGVEAAKELCRNTRGPIASIYYQ